MLAAHEQRFLRIYEDRRDRPAGDYAELLRRGEVVSRDRVDLDAWRAEIRRQAGRDRVRVMTSVSGGRAFATLNPPLPTARDQIDRLLARAAEQLELLGGLDERSRTLGHQLVGWISHDDEYISWCQRCAARVYARIVGRLIEDGEALDDACPTEAA
jgi:hypothetical protein